MGRVCKERLHTDYADLVKRLRATFPDDAGAILEEAADAVAFLARELEGDPYGAGFDAAREVIATYVALNFDNGIELAAQIRGVQPDLSTDRDDKGSDGQ